MRRVRRVEVPIEQNLAPDTVVRLRVDLGETLGGNWGDAARRGVLDRIDLDLVGADPAHVRLDAVALLREGAVPEPFAARSAVAEIGGSFQPSWWVRGGASVGFAVDLPADGSELRWRDGALAGGEEPRVELVAGGRASLLDSVSHAKPSAGWQARRIPLTGHAGEHVVLRLSNGGTGTALFGDPRIVPTGARQPAGNVLVVLIDTLRADHVGAFGADFDGITPTLDRMIRDGVGFEMALSHSPWTKPTVATVMTGLLPTTHRVGSRTLSDRVPGSVALVQERFRSAGWRTGSFAANPLGSTLSGLERGFGTALAPRFWRGRTQLGPHPSASQLRAELLSWLDEEPDRPFFAYVHVMEVHPGGRRHHGRGTPSGYTLYAAAVHAADQDLADLLSALDDRGRLDDTLVVVLGDHGDSFGQHGRPMAGHGTSLFQDQIHVPLVFWQPGGPAREPIATPVGLSDVAPTLLALFDLPPLEEADGADLAGLWTGGGAVGRPVASALIRFPHAPDAPRQDSLVTPERHKALRIGDEQRLAFDLDADPDERGGAAPADADALLRTLDRLVEAEPERARRFRERHGASQAGAVDAEELERLKELGYVP
jgi:arylsulfatase A-like enzyme